jgi:DNA-binding CsgD family transcriptional regulator
MPKVIDNCAGTPLSPAELRALKGLLEGRTYKEMGYEFGCAASTVATHIMWVRRKWGVKKSSKGALLLEYLHRREAILDRALRLIGIEFPGRTTDERTWDQWRARCVVVISENERTSRLL